MTSREFTDIYCPLSDSAYRVAYYLLESEQDAQDAVQDLFIKLWNSLDALDAVHNPQAYCTTLIKNICIDRIRKRQCQPDAPPPEDMGLDSDIQRDLEDREKLRCLRDAIQKLPDAQRTVLQMKVFEDLSYEEISEKTGMNNLTLRVLLSQARTKLRKLL